MWLAELHCTFAQMHTCAYICARVRTHMYVHMCARVHTHVRTYVRVCAHTHVHTYTAQLMLIKLILPLADHFEQLTQTDTDMVVDLLS